MKAVFVDTGAFVAKEIAGDQFHALAVEAWAELMDRGIGFVSSEHVLDESATLIARRGSYAFAAQWGLDALESGIEWRQSAPEDLAKASGLMRKFADQGVSFTDCLSAVLMRRSGLRRVFGFDRHFEAMGFEVWPGQPE